MMMKLILYYLLLFGLIECNADISMESKNHLKQGERYIILSLDRLGLANRLRSMADWYQIASLSGRKLVVSWVPSYDCNSSFDSLFKINENMLPPGLQVLSKPLSSSASGVQAALEVSRHDALELGLSFHALYYKEHVAVDSITEEFASSAIGDDGGESQGQGMYAPNFNTFIANRETFVKGKDVIFTNYDGILVFPGIPCQHYFSSKSSFYQELHPLSDIQKAVDDIYSTYFSHKLMIGVHIRMHVDGFDWAVVPPGGNNPPPDSNDNSSPSSSAQRFGVGANVKEFASIMYDIENKFKSTFAKDDLALPKFEVGNKVTDGDLLSPIRFFIASNSDNIKDQILSQFPDAMALTGPVSRDLPDGVQFALIEWLLLSRSQLVLHTYGSSFAEEAAAVRAVPLVGIWEGYPILHHYIPLPFCGHQQYMRAYAKQGWHGSFTEPGSKNSKKADDGRAVSSVSFVVIDCVNHLTDWGINGLLCFGSDEQAKVALEDA
jgi:hypothetical protein